MNNKIEILRAICFTEEDIKSITNFGDAFSKKEIEFMIEFKKIYELGLDQLKKFVDKLDEEGKDLDSYSIRYYIDILSNGPLGAYLPDLFKDKKYLETLPDVLGTVGNMNRTTQNVTVWNTDRYPLVVSVDTFNKLPPFSQSTLGDSIKQVEDVFRTSLLSSVIVDNTLPIVNKNNKKRHDEEPAGKWGTVANGNYLVKDVYYFTVILEISQSIFEAVKEQIGEEHFRIYKDFKLYSPFNPLTNESKAINNKIEKATTENDLTVIDTLDLMGDVVDSFARRESKLIVPSDEEDKEYLLHTVEGQLGN
jgi:hypothetical protein